MNTILCVKWGDKYDDTYVEKLKEQCEKNCAVPFNFYCIVDSFGRIGSIMRLHWIVVII